MICMDEEKENAKTEEETHSEEKEEQSEEDEQNNVQDDAQVPMTFEKMLFRCEEQIDSSHDPMKIKFAKCNNDTCNSIYTWIVMKNFKEQVETEKKMKNKEEDVTEQICQHIKLTHSVRIIWSDVHTKK